MISSRRRFSLGMDRYSGLYLWALFIVVFGVWKTGLFLSQATLHSVASSQSIVAILAIAVLIPMAAGAYDLSVGATINFSAIVAAVLQTNKHWDMWAAIAVAVVCGIAIGVVNGFIVVKLRVNSFIATLGMATIVTAVQEIVSGQAQPLPPTSNSWNQLTQYTVFGFQIVVLYLVVLALLAWWVLDFTPAGRYIRATGSNPEAARLAGVNVSKWTWLSLIASGGICGVGGVLFASLNGPSLTFGAGLLLPAFAAVFLGSTQFQPGRVNLWGTLVSVYVLATGVEGLQLVTGVQWLSDMFNGCALIGAVSFAVWRQKAASRRPRELTRPAEPDSEDGDAKRPTAVDASPALPAAKMRLQGRR